MATLEQNKETKEAMQKATRIVLQEGITGYNHTCTFDWAHMLEAVEAQMSIILLLASVIVTIAFVQLLFNF